MPLSLTMPEPPEAIILPYSHSLSQVKVFFSSSKLAGEQLATVNAANRLSTKHGSPQRSFLPDAEMESSPWSDLGLLRLCVLFHVMVLFSQPVQRGRRDKCAENA